MTIHRTPKLAGLACSMVLVALALVPTASANKPTREIVPAPGDRVFTDQCASPVLGHIEGGEINTTFTDKTGDPVKLLGAFPGQTLTLTNLDTGELITVVNAGSFQARAERDGSVTISITGRGPIPNFITGEPGLWYLAGGRVVVTLDEHGNPMSVDVSGNIVNLCTQLGP
jgi:hypothetical protein